MLKRLRHALSHLWRRSQTGSGERQVAKARARFWAEMREGQREARAHSAPEWMTPAKAVSDLSAGKVEQQERVGESQQ